MPSPIPPVNSASSALEGALARLAEGRDLDEAATEAVFAEIMSGSASAPLIADLLLALRAKGESAAEIAGAVRALRGAMRRVAHPEPERLVDTCGTGGGAITTVNISTAAAFLAAGAGVTIAKHGNRSYTSRSGSADVLEALGIAIDLDPEHAARVLNDVGIVFLFAPSYHPAMRHVAPIRRQLAVPTVMNLVGPLANPASVGRQVVGVGDPARAPAMAGALARLGAIHALVLHAAIGMDEISPVGTTAVWEIRDGHVREWEFDPGVTAIGTISLAGLEGGEPHENATKMMELLERPATAAPALRSAVVLNAAAAIYVAGIAPTLHAAVDAAMDSLQSGRARERLEALRGAATIPSTSL
jgi:anthranilate phosphoribosyltransferase